MTASHRFGRFAIPFRVLLLFSLRMARLTAAETSSTEGKRDPRMGSFNSWNKSKSGGLMSGLYGAWSNLANRSQPSPGADVHRRAKWMAHLWASQVGFCAFYCAVFAFRHDNTLLSHLLLMELCHHDFSVIISQDHHLLDLWLSSSKFLGSRGGRTSPLLDCDFNSGSKSLTHVSSIAIIRYRNAWPPTLNLCYSNIAISRRFCFCSAVQQWGTHRAQIFLFCKSFVKTRNTDVGEIPVSCNISSHVNRRSCARKSATSFTLRSSGDVFGLPDLGSSFMVTFFTKRSSPTGNYTTVHCLLTTNCTTVHCLLTTNCTTVQCLLTINCTTVHCLLIINCTTAHCLLTTNCTTVHCLLTINCTTVHCLLTTNCTTVHCLLITNRTTVHCLLTTNFTQSTANFCRVFAT